MLYEIDETALQFLQMLRLRPKRQCRADVLIPQTRKICKDLFRRHATGQILQGIGHRDTCAADRGFTAAHLGINGDPFHQIIHSSASTVQTFGMFNGSPHSRTGTDSNPGTADRLCCCYAAFLIST